MENKDEKSPAGGSEFMKYLFAITLAGLFFFLCWSIGDLLSSYSDQRKQLEILYMDSCIRDGDTQTRCMEKWSYYKYQM